MESRALRKMALTTPEARLRRIQKGCGIIEKLLIVLIILLGIQILMMIDMAVSEWKLNFLFATTFGDAGSPGMLGAFGVGQLSEELAKGALQKLILWLSCETAIVMLFFILLCNIASATKNSGTPFLLKNARRLQLAGWILLALGLISPVMRRLILSSGFETVSASAWEPVTLLTAGILLVLAKMFEYGCMLQQEYDETL